MPVSFLGFNNSSTIKDVLDGVKKKTIAFKDNDERHIVYAMAAWCGRGPEIAKLLANASGLSKVEASTVVSSGLFIKGPSKTIDEGGTPGQRAMPIPSSGTIDEDMNLKDFVDNLNNNTIQIPWGNNTIKNKNVQGSEASDKAKKYKERFLGKLCPGIIVI